MEKEERVLAWLEFIGVGEEGGFRDSGFQVAYCSEFSRKLEYIELYNSVTDCILLANMTDVF